MKFNFGKRFKLEEAEKKTESFNSSPSFPGENESAPIDEDVDSSIIQNKPRPKETQGSTGNSIRRIRTYKEDIAEAVRTQKASLMSITSAEQKKHANIFNDITKKPPVDFKKIGTILWSIIFIVLGTGSIVFFMFFY